MAGRPIRGEAVMPAVQWYERIARVFDIALFDRLFYRTARVYAINRLALSPEDTFLDLFCGSGVNFPLLRERLGSEGRIIGVDGSPAMLRRAAVRASLLPGEPDIQLLQADFTTQDGVVCVRETIARYQPCGILLTLGLTCLPNWREFFGSVYDAAPAGARFAILDAFCERLTFGARLIDATATADCTRPVWHELEARCEEFGRRAFHPYRLLDASVFVAVGTKPG